MKLVALHRRILQQPDTQRHDVVAQPVGDIAIDCDRAVSLMPAKFCIALGIQELVGAKSLHARRFCLRGFFG